MNGEAFSLIFRKFLSESHFNSQVTQGLMIALRDAHVSPGEKPALQGVMFNDRSNGVMDAIQSVIGMELSDAELHGLPESRRESRRSRRA